MSHFEQYSIYYYVIAFVCFTCATWRLYFTSLVWRRRLPPGDMGLPLLGHTLQFARKRFQLFDELHTKYGDVLKLHLLGRPTVRVRGPVGVSVVLKGEQKYVRSAWLSSTIAMIGQNSVSMSSGELHKRRKRRLAWLLSSTNISSSFGVISRVMERHLDDWSKQEHVSLYKALSQMFVDVILSVCIGDNAAGLTLEKEARMLSEGSFSVPLDLPGTTFRKGMQARESLISQMSSIIDDIVNKNMASCPLVDMLNALGEEDEIDRDYIADLLIELLNAGRETNTSAACNLVINIARNSRVHQELRREIRLHGLLEDGVQTPTYDVLRKLDYVHGTVKEVLRLRPPVGGGFRVATQSFQVSGLHIPRDWAVIYSIRNTHATQDLPDRDSFCPERWRRENPQRPDAERFAYIPFGGGVRACPGRLLATVALKLFVVHVTRKYRVHLLEGDFGPVPGMTTPRPSDNAYVKFHRL